MASPVVENNVSINSARLEVTGLRPLVGHRLRGPRRLLSAGKDRS